jgi:hypothetical protein
MTQRFASNVLTKVETRYGTLQVLDVENDVVGRFLQRYGEWGWDEVRFVASVLPDRARVLDIGAYLGTFGLGIALQKPLAFLCLVEANPSVIPQLKANVRDPPPLNWSTPRYVFLANRRTKMPRKRHKPEEIVAKLRQVDVLVSRKAPNAATFVGTAW